MGLILNFDTATPVCSVALARDGDVIAMKESKKEKSHAALLTVFIEQILNETKTKINQLDAIAVSKGPGSYTGLRIGVSTAKGLCYGSDIPLISINTLLAMNNGMVKHINQKTIENLPVETAFYCPMLDARRMEIYTAVFNYFNKTIIETKAMIVDEHLFFDLLDNNPVVFFGDGVEKYKNIVNHQNAYFVDNFEHSAAHMTELSNTAFKKKKFEDVAYFEPFYLKDFIATTPKKKVLE